MPEPDPNAPPEGEPKPPEPPKPEGNVDDLPQWARDQLTKANREAAGYRTKVKELEPLAQKAKELEDASKSNEQKLTEERDTHKGTAETNAQLALKYEVALDKGLTSTQAKRLVGTTKEELEKDADELLESFGGGKGSDDGKTGTGRRPKERLRPGAVPDAEPDETDPRKLAAQVPRR